MSSSATNFDDLLARYTGAGQPAVVVGVYRAGALGESAAVGLASIEHGIAATPGTVFDIASVSKQFAATCVLLLEQDGLLGFDDDLREHLPAMRLRNPITLRQCAQHTAGLRDYMALAEVVGAGPESGRREDSVVRQLCAQRDTEFAPGSDWSYSNSGYIALAAVVRAVTGRSFAEVARDRILTPLGMSATKFQDDASAIVASRAAGYVRRGDGFARADSMDEVVGDGGLLTTAVDLAGWHRFLGGGDVLGEPVRERLLTRAVLSDGRTIPYASGLQHHTVHGRAAVGHGGAIEGYRAYLLQLLNEPLGVTVLANRSDADAGGLARAVIGRLLGDEEPRPAAPTRHMSARRQVDPAGLWYSTVSDAFLSSHLKDGGRLTLEIGPIALHCAADGDGRWRSEGSYAGLMVRIDVDTLTVSQGDDDWNPSHYTRVVAGEPPDDDEIRSLVGSYFSDELGALAQVNSDTSGLILAVGLAPAETLEPISPGCYRSPTKSVHVTRIDGGISLLVSSVHARRIRFRALGRAVRPIGLPICLGGNEVEELPSEVRSP